MRIVGCGIMSIAAFFAFCFEAEVGAPLSQQYWWWLAWAGITAIGYRLFRLGGGRSIRDVYRQPD